MGQYSKQNHRINEIVDALTKAAGETIDLSCRDARTLQDLVAASTTRTERQFMTCNQWRGYRVFESCANKSRLDAVGRLRKLSDKRNYEELRAAVAEGPFLAAARAVDARMIDSARHVIRLRERFGRPRRCRREAALCY